MIASELRIGNFIGSTKIDGGFIVGKISKSKINGHLTFDVIEPIPISIVWLNRFDIQVYDIMGGNIFLAFREIWSYDINFMLVDDVLKVSLYGADWKKAVQIKYVHQLQNLFFALMGEELTLK